MNGPILCISSVSDVVAASVVEAEYGCSYKNSKAGVYNRHILEAMGYPQPSTILLTDNEVVVGLTYDRFKQKCSKAIDQRFHWIRDRVKQKQFEARWIAGKENKADFFTKIYLKNH
jgi:hypothetical protein